MIKIRDHKTPITSIKGFLKAYRSNKGEIVIKTDVRTLLNSPFDRISNEDIVCKYEALFLSFFNQFGLDVSNKFQFEVDSFDEIIIVMASLVDSNYLKIIKGELPIRKVLKRLFLLRN